MKAGAVIALGIAAAGVIWLVSRAKGAQKEIALAVGWNEVTYTGSRKEAGIAFQSIADYLMIVYYYDAVDEMWRQVLGDTTLETGMILSIRVTQDCIWKFY